MHDALLSEIEQFLKETGMKPYRFGYMAVRNGRLVERLRHGQTPQGKAVRLWPDTVKQIRAFMAAQRRSRQRAPQPASEEGRAVA